MIKHSNSWWGIKNSGEDISLEIMRIVNNAELFVIVCGYNFSFKTSGASRQFFDALINKNRNGVPVLMIFPPYLSMQVNPQPKIINHLIRNGVAIILNHHNHSKWLLTDKDLYYGSSNFTLTSWNKKVEVLSIHEHTNLNKSWARNTIKDFKQFIDAEVNNLTSSGRRMKSYRGLLTSTRSAWKSIKPLVKKFNPSIIKVIETLENYDEILNILNKSLVDWFDYYQTDKFEFIFELNSKIIIAIDSLAEYAYSNIYNETIDLESEITDQQIINQYNLLFQKAIVSIDNAIDEIQNDEFVNDQYSYSDLREANFSRIIDIKKLLDKTIQ
jgi:hypothetical protein